MEKLPIQSRSSLRICSQWRGVRGPVYIQQSLLQTSRSCEKEFNFKVFCWVVFLFQDCKCLRETFKQPRACIFSRGTEEALALMPISSSCSAVCMWAVLSVCPSAPCPSQGAVPAREEVLGTLLPAGTPGWGWGSGTWGKKVVFSNFFFFFSLLPLKRIGKYPDS